MKRQLMMVVCAAGLLSLGGVAFAQAGGGGGGTPGAPKVEPRTTEKTVEALRGAYWTSVRSGEFYGKAATKADAEGMAGVASLMRAAQRVESVHAGVYTKQLEELKSDTGKAKDSGGAALEVKTTKENVATAVKLATTARETDLPAARKVAEGDGVRDAAKAFRDSREGQIELVRLFKDAAELSDAWKKSKRDFFVGRTCGYIVEKLDLTKCPVCSKGRDDFEKVN